MSVDYEVYLSGNMPEEALCAFGFTEESRSDEVIRGAAFGGSLFIAVASGELNDAFVREEVGFNPLVKMVLSPDIEQYDKSMDAIIEVFNYCVDFFDKVKIYQNNEMLLLEKREQNTLLYNKKNSWWNSYLDVLMFKFTEK